MTTPIATIFIPFADYHKQVVEHAFRSAVNQTIECEVIIGASPGTPALLRNQAMNAKTDFCVFLDADDEMESNFVEECLKTYETARYVYTAWYEGERVMMPRSCNPFLEHNFNDGRGGVGGYHLVTTLFPTELFRYMGGFVEDLPGMEDVDFYMRAQRAGICGILCDKPLLHYNGLGETRAKKFRASPEYEDVRDMIIRTNGGMATMAGCCGISGGGSTVDTKGAQPGDIPAMVLQPGTQRGRATDRWYDRGMFIGAVVMIDPRDVEKMPEVYRAMTDLREIAPKREKVLKESGLV